MTVLHRVNSIPVVLPERLIMSRMGCNHHLTEISPRQREMIMKHVIDGFSLCRPRGIWGQFPIREWSEERVVLVDGGIFVSRALAALLRGCEAVWMAAVTVGPELSEAIGQRGAGDDGVSALVYDAVGGETADAAMDWLQDYGGRELRRFGQVLASRRFSPGYSDLDLSSQRTIFNALELESWGLKLTETYIMTPEKSVTAIAGIESPHKES